MSLLHKRILSGTIIFCTLTLFSQQNQNILSGYEKDISGEVLSYHSFHPYATSALLTRCNTGKMTIAWETERIPDNWKSKEVLFRWIGGFSMGTSDANRYFDLMVNGNKVLTFTTHPGSDTSNWTITGTSGVRLSYTHVWVDHVYDAFGYFILTVPFRADMAGKPVRLEVTGHAMNDDDWYMTFRHTFRESVQARMVQALEKKENRVWQVVRVIVDYPGTKGTLKVKCQPDKAVVIPLKLGYNMTEVLVPVVAKDTIINLTVWLDNEKIRYIPVRLSPVVQREIWIIHHSHNDIGYTDLQPNILALQIRNLRDALKLIQKTASYPEEAKFRWNSEIMWAVDGFLQQASEQEKEEFLQAVRDGQMGLQALYTNPLTGLARPEELMRLTDVACNLRDQYHLPISTGMVSDIPGFSWSIVPALQHKGIRYFTSGPNTGDRIGHSTEAWGDRPFWWVSPDGTGKILFWMAGKGYSMFHQTRTIRTNRDFANRLFAYLDELSRNRYPYQMVQIRYTVYSDNGPVDPTLPDFVREWNEKYITPRLVIGTTEAMFAKFEKEYGANLPAFAGDFTPYWEDGAVSTARETALNRKASNRAAQAEMVSSILGKALDKDTLSVLWKNIHLFTEHTWGAWNSVSEPDDPGARGQWQIKQQFALEADRLSEKVLREALSGFMNVSESKTIEVINSLSWPRSGIVKIQNPDPSKFKGVVTSDGKPVLSQMLTTGEMAFLAEDVPPLGSKLFRLTAEVPGAKVNLPRIDNGIQNSRFRLLVDTLNGSISSLLDLTTGREYADEGLYGGINSFVYIKGLSPDKAYVPGKISLCIKEAGPLVQTIEITGKVEGAQDLVREISLLEGLDYVVIADRINKIARREKEACYFAFPFRVEHPVVRYDAGWGVVRPDCDQLAGACRDFFSVQRWVDFSAQDYGITLATAEAPLVEFGEIADETGHNSGPKGWKTTAPGGSVAYSFVMNNYWHTNYKADQEGWADFSYALRPHAMFQSAQAYRFGNEMDYPLLSRFVPNDYKGTDEIFSLNSHDILVTRMQWERNGKILMLRLFNMSGQPVQVAFRWKHFLPQTISMEGSGIRLPAESTFSVPAYGIITMRCE
ncbi:MAG: glycoside hydrolase family 38 C-terminal domain-containing protein [Bacteroidales bacterium]